MSGEVNTRLIRPGVHKSRAKRRSSDYMLYGSV